jgi:hypothetical protein
LFKERKDTDEKSEIIQFREDRRVLYVRKNRFGKEEVQSFLYYDDVANIGINESKEISVEHDDIDGINVKTYSVEEIGYEAKLENTDHEITEIDESAFPF